MKLLFFIVLFAVVSGGRDYEQIFKDDYKNAVDYIEQSKNSFRQKCRQFDVDPDLAISIVFPELIRYSYFFDFFETAALELMYVQYGQSYSDFSIGRFQMKPSFIEELEEKIKQTPDLQKKYSNILAYHAKSNMEIRRERIARLKIQEWQTLYLMVFCDITHQLYPDKEWKDKSEKIRYYATVYNCGIHHSAGEIDKRKDLKTFPFGVKAKGESQFAYGDVSREYYLRHLSGNSPDNVRDSD